MLLYIGFRACVCVCVGCRARGVLMRGISRVYIAILLNVYEDAIEDFTLIYSIGNIYLQLYVEV